MRNKIFVKKKYLVFREDARKLARKISKGSAREIFIDFSRVVFASRSFIDELLTQIEKQKKDIKFLGLNSALSKFIPKIKKTKSEIQRVLSRS